MNKATLLTVLMNGNYFSRTISPILGTELLTDPSLEANYTSGKCDTLSFGGSPTCTQSADAHSGSKAQAFTAAAQYNLAAYTITLAQNDWYMASVWGKRTAGSFGGLYTECSDGSASKKLLGYYTDAVYTQKLATFRAVATGAVAAGYRVIIESRGSGFDTAIVDDVSLKKLTLTSCFGLHRYTTPTGNVTITSKISVKAYAQAGFWLCVDDASNPANGILCYVDKAKIYLEKLVAGTYSNVWSPATQAWTDGDELKVVKSGTTVQVFRNGAQVGADQTVSDATVKDNTTHVQFSTYSENIFNTFSVV